MVLGIHAGHEVDVGVGVAAVFVGAGDAGQVDADRAGGEVLAGHNLGALEQLARLLEQVAARRQRRDGVGFPLIDGDGDVDARPVSAERDGGLADANVEEAAVVVEHADALQVEVERGLLEGAEPAHEAEVGLGAGLDELLDLVVGERLVADERKPRDAHLFRLCDDILHHHLADRAGLDPGLDRGEKEALLPVHLFDGGDAGGDALLVEDGALGERQLLDHLRFFDGIFALDLDAGDGGALDDDEAEEDGVALRLRIDGDIVEEAHRVDGSDGLAEGAAGEPHAGAECDLAVDGLGLDANGAADLDAGDEGGVFFGQLRVGAGRNQAQAGEREQGREEETEGAHGATEVCSESCRRRPSSMMRRRLMEAASWWLWVTTTTEI